MNLMIVIHCGIIAAVSFGAFLVCMSKYRNAQERLFSEAAHGSQEVALLTALRLLGESPIEVEDPEGLFAEADHQSARTSFWHKAMMVTALLCIGSLVIGTFFGF